MSEEKRTRQERIEELERDLRAAASSISALREDHEGGAEIFPRSEIEVHAYQNEPTKAVTLGSSTGPDCRIRVSTSGEDVVIYFRWKNREGSPSDSAEITLSHEAAELIAQKILAEE